MPLTDAQQKALNRQTSIALGSVPGPTGEAAASGQFGFFSVTVLPGQSFPLPVFGDFIYILSITTTGGVKYGNGALTPPGLLGLLTVTDDNAVTMPIEEEGRSLIFPKSFKTLFFANNNKATALPATFNCFIGSGRIVREGRVQQIAGVTAFPGPFGLVRPNNVTPYAAAQALTDVSGNFLEIKNCVRFPGGSGKIKQARIVKSSATIANADFTAFIYAFNPVTVGDQLPYPFLSNQVLVGIIRFPAFITGGAGSNGAVCELDGISVPFNLSIGGSSLFVQFMANAAYVPAANETFTLALGIDQD